MLEELAETVRAHRPTPVNRPFPDWLRREIVEAARPVLDQGHSLQAVASAIGISATSLYRWNRSVDKSSGFRPVVLQTEEGPETKATFEIRSPRGFTVAGLGLEDVAVLLGKLG